jgi:hypothetical protein
MGFTHKSIKLTLSVTLSYHPIQFTFHFAVFSWFHYAIFIIHCYFNKVAHQLLLHLRMYFQKLHVILPWSTERNTSHVHMP